MCKIRLFSFMSGMNVNNELMLGQISVSSVLSASVMIFSGLWIWWDASELDNMLV